MILGPAVKKKWWGPRPTDLPVNYAYEYATLRSQDILVQQIYIQFILWLNLLCYIVPPKISSPDSLYRKVIVGDSVELPCNASGTPKPRLIWQKGTSIMAGAHGKLLLFIPVWFPIYVIADL